jgi:hypothetical protein
VDEKRFVTLDQLMEIFPFIRRSRVCYLTTVKGIPFYRVGRSLVFEIGEIRQWVEAGRVPSVSAKPVEPQHENLPDKKPAKYLLRENTPAELEVDDAIPPNLKRNGGQSPAGRAFL